MCGHKIKALVVSTCGIFLFSEPFGGSPFCYFESSARHSISSCHLDNAAAHGNLAAAAAHFDRTVFVIENHCQAAGGLNGDGLAGPRVIKDNLVSAA
jgi:hypothetical protein